MSNATVSIITIGDELLIGQVIDTNSAWMAQELNRIGIQVVRRVAAGDVWEAIWTALDQESQAAEIVLMTGGLGPTSDDITKHLLCKYFDGTLVLHQPTLEHVRNLFVNLLKKPMLASNEQQAYVPDVCQVLPNPVGTAPAMLFQKENKLFISMPGVPFEMKQIMQASVLPLLTARYQTAPIQHRTLLTVGIGESFLSERLKNFESQLPENFKLAYLPNLQTVRLRLSAWGNISKELFEERFGWLIESVGEFVAATEDTTIEKAVAALLKDRKLTLSTAESCTGGYIAQLMTASEGASLFFKGSVIAYSNEIKTSLLGVPLSVLSTEGAVSESTVRIMAGQVKERLHTDCSIAVSGIMGPGGGSEHRPVGTVWIAVAGPFGIITKCLQLRHDRERNIKITAVMALDLLRIHICGKPLDNLV